MRVSQCIRRVIIIVIGIMITRGIRRARIIRIRIVITNTCSSCSNMFIIRRARISAGIIRSTRIRHGRRVESSH